MAARNHISLIEKTMQLLEILAERGEDAALKELTWRTGLVKSSVFRILYTLKELGYVDQTEPTRLYRLTWKVYSLGKGSPLLDLAKPHMIKLRDEMRETVWLAEWLWNKGVGVIAVRVEGPQALTQLQRKTLVAVGSAVSLHSSAAGKSIAAHLPPNVLKAALGSERLPHLTANTIQTREQLRVELERTRRRRYAVNKAESSTSLFAVGAPIFDSWKTVIGSVAIPVVGRSPEKWKAAGEAVKLTAAAITADLSNVRFVGRSKLWGPSNWAISER